MKSTVSLISRDQSGFFIFISFTFNKDPWVVQLSSNRILYFNQRFLLKKEKQYRASGSVPSRVKISFLLNFLRNLNLLFSKQ